VTKLTRYRLDLSYKDATITEVVILRETPNFVYLPSGRVNGAPRRSAKVSEYGSYFTTHEEAIGYAERAVKRRKDLAQKEIDITTKILCSLARMRLPTATD
jgi:hypothetical protein